MFSDLWAAICGWRVLVVCVAIIGVGWFVLQVLALAQWLRTVLL